MIIIRNDDVSANTDLIELEEIYDIIKRHVPNAEIWSCYNVLSKSAINGAVYPDLPLSNQQLHYFFNVSNISMPNNMIKLRSKVVSHGLLHCDHTRLSLDAQKMSIITSCKLLNTDRFVPPFSKYNNSMEHICVGNGIEMSKREDGWKSLESEPFDPKHPLWFFHSWRYTPAEFEERLLNVVQSNKCSV